MMRQTAIAALLVLIPALLAACTPGITRLGLIAFNGQSLHMKSTGIGDTLSNRMDVIVDGPQHLDNNRCDTNAAYTQYLSESAGTRFTTITEDYRGKIQLDGSVLPMLGSSHTYHLAAIWERDEDIFSVYEYIDITDVLLIQQPYMTGEYKFRIFINTILAVAVPVLILLLSAWLVARLKRRAREQPTWPAPDDRP
jgi:hypothetical protein